MNSFEDIYFSMLGQLIPKCRLPWVGNAFAKGSLCDLAYEEMREAYERLCERLQVEEEDQDLDTIVDCMETIQRDLCERMFECGKRYLLEQHYLDIRK